MVHIRAEDTSPDAIGTQVLAAVRQMATELEAGALARRAQRYSPAVKHAPDLQPPLEFSIGQFLNEGCDLRFNPCSVSRQITAAPSRTNKFRGVQSQSGDQCREGLQARYAGATFDMRYRFHRQADGFRQLRLRDASLRPRRPNGGGHRMSDVIRHALPDALPIRDDLGSGRHHICSGRTQLLVRLGLWFAASSRVSDWSRLLVEGI